MFKFVRNLFIVVVLLLVLLFFVVQSFQVDVVEEDLPTHIYEEDTTLLDIVYDNMFDIFVGNEDNLQDLVEDTINLVLYDSIKENVNPDYDPVGDCDTDACNYILLEEDYYIDYAWATMTEDEELVLHIGVGSDSYLDFHTIIHVYFDVDIKFIAMDIVLTLDHVEINKTGISVSMIDRVVSNFDKDQIESYVTDGELDLDEYTYTISFNPFS